jgi:integrase
MASLKKRGGVWYAQYYAEGQRNPKRQSLRTGDKALAKRRLVELEEALAAGHSEIGPSRTPLPEILEAYVQHARTHKKPGTVSAEITYLRDTFGPVCRSLRPANLGDHEPPPPPRDKAPRLNARFIEDITTAQIADALNARARLRNLSPKTYNHYRSILSKLFNWAMDERNVRFYRDRNPASKVKRRSEQQHDIRFLSRDEITQQLNALEERPQLQVMVAAYIFGGFRREELLWLRREDVDFAQGENGVIHIRSKRVGGERWCPKTKRNRVVPISKELSRRLRAYRPPKDSGGWFFPSPEGCRWDPNNFSRHLRIAQQESGLAWTCLDFRHTFGSHLAMKGESLYKIATLMGNSPEIVRRHYASLLPESLFATVEFFEHEITTAKEPEPVGNVIPFRRGA